MGEQRQQFAKRLQEAMRKEGLDPKPGVLVRLFNLNHASGPSVSFQSASRWLKGGALPDADKLQTLAKVLDVDPCHLMFGERTRLAVAEPRPAWPEELGSPDRQMIQTYLRLAAAKRRLVQDLVAHLAEAG